MATSKFRITLFGSFNKKPFNCLSELRRICNLGRRLLRKSNFEIGIVGDGGNFTHPPPENTKEFIDWVETESNHYIDVSDFLIFTILKRCDNTTPTKEAEYALDNDYHEKTLIVLEKQKGGDDFSAGSLYTLSGWCAKYDDIPILYMNFEDYHVIWNNTISKIRSWSA